jgi:hypothetical protein
MLQRSLFGAFGLVALAGLALTLSTGSQAKADEPGPAVHLQISLYELREAKDDVRNVDGIPDKQRTEILGGIDSAITQMKKTIESMGAKVEYIAPAEGDRGKLTNFKHLRHAIKELKAAKEQVQSTKGLSDADRDAGTVAINKCIVHLEKALEFVKD